MGSDWLELLDCVLRPARPGLVRCLAECDRYLEQQRSQRELRARELADCEQRINQARAAVFRAADGVVGARMTELERQWRQLSRRRNDSGVMDLWAGLVPFSWVDRKRFRDSPPELWLDAAVALAADVENVERAERAVLLLWSRLAPFGERFWPPVRWRMVEQDPEPIAPLLAGALSAATQAIPAPQRAGLIERAERVEQRVLTAALERLPARPLLARDIAHAAWVDCMWRFAALADDASPVAALRALWQTGYVLSDIDARGVTLELPPLPVLASRQ
jgi:hypothetical protein